MSSAGEALKNRLFDVMRDKGAVLCGVGDMSGIAADGGMTVGVSAAVRVPPHIVRDLMTAPTLEYMRMYNELNERLNGIVSAGAELLIREGHSAKANTTDSVVVNEERCSPIPHKTFATRAGLGWIGKNCLLVTPQYGCAIRLSSLLTDAPLPFDEPITMSRCGDCSVCVSKCPGSALKGTLWRAGMSREEIVDRELCRETQLRRMEEATGVRKDLCGMCFAVCPYTQRAISGQ